MATSMTMTVTGKLMSDPLYKPAEGTKLAYLRFRIIHNPFGKKQDGVTPLDPISVNVSLIGKPAETIHSFLKKDTLVTTTGRVTNNKIAVDESGSPVKYKNGEYVVNLDISAFEVTLVGSKNDNPAATTTPAANTSSMTMEIDAPF